MKILYSSIILKLVLKLAGPLFCIAPIHAFRYSREVQICRLLPESPKNLKRMLWQDAKLASPEQQQAAGLAPINTNTGFHSDSA